MVAVLSDIYQPQTAIFAAGCFWGVQFYFDEIPGVTETLVGYTGGTKDNPTYEEVCMHTTGHAEAVRITFNPEQVSYDTLLKQFFRMHNPTQLNRQGPDVGDSYRTAIFYINEAQKQQAENAKADAQKNIKDPIVTEITAASDFWPAEDYHQKFTRRTGHGMCHVPYEAVQ
jgi:methionine-S-sulfoxide reductase